MNRLPHRNIVVMKFGGTSVANINKMKNASEIIAKYTYQGYNAVVIVSAMAGQTNALIDLWGSVSHRNDSREYDKLLATGEVVSAALLAEILRNKGLNAKSFSGMEAGIATNNNHGDAEIIDIDVTNINNQLKERGSIAVVAGFQGFYRNNGDTTTLGRGGSDTSAVAMAKAMELNRCIIYTDVDGVYGIDPNILATAKRIPLISHMEMLDFAKAGAKVLHEKSVKTALEHNIDIHVLSTKDNGNNHEAGTVVSSNKYKIDDRNTEVIGIAVGQTFTHYQVDLTKADGGILHMIKEIINSENIHTQGDKIVFRVAKQHDERVMELLNNFASKTAIQVDKHRSTVAVIGNLDHNNHTQKGKNIHDKIITVLTKNSVGHVIDSVTPSCITIMVDSNYKELAARLLYNTFIAQDAT